MDVFKLSILGVMLVAFASAMYLTGKFIYHMLHIVRNVTGKYAYFLGALLLFMPSQFNEVGNLHRAKLLNIFPFMFLSYSVVFGIKFYIEAQRAV